MGISGAIFAAVLLTVAVSVDTLASGFGYGAAKTEVSFSRVIIISIIGAGFLALSLFFGFAIGQIISPRITIIISVAALSFIGGLKIFQCFYRRDKKNKFVQQISWGETIVLSVALSVDNIVAGLGASVYNANIVFCVSVIVFSFVGDIILFSAGYAGGKKVANKKTTLDLSWLGGVVLILLAVGKVLF